MSIRKDKSVNSLKAVEDCLAELSTADESIVREALSAGHDLSNFSVQVNEELTEAHRIAVKECIQNADKLTDLHNQILACDQVFEKMLLGFQGDLGTISEDMKRLQEQSVSINQELENRQKVRGELSQVIMETDVNDRAFLEQLHELQHKINFIKAQSPRMRVQDEYVDTVSKMFFSYFKAYVTRLFKLL
ncbi:hypothetical protein OSTOST_24437, partial [Ostertagia ostertagi]